MKLPLLSDSDQRKSSSWNQSKLLINPSRLNKASRVLTSRQKNAFYKVFQFFDHKKNGRISYEEFLETLHQVGMVADENAVLDLINCQDDNDNGEMDFEEFLNFMTNDDIFGSTLIKEGEEKHKIMYEVLSKFLSRSILEDPQRTEIVNYFTKKLRKVAQKHPFIHAAHVVHHYADGARSLGLTEKEIFNQIETIKQNVLKEGDEKKKNSPYALPIQLILTPTDANKSSKTQGKQPGWNTPRANNYQVKLPRIKVKESKTFENVRNIRKKVETVKDDYYWNLSKAQHKNFNRLWTNLHVSNIPTNRLRTMMEGVYSAYTASRLTGCRGSHAAPAERDRPDIRAILERRIMQERGVSHSDRKLLGIFLKSANNLARFMEQQRNYTTNAFSE